MVVRIVEMSASLFRSKFLPLRNFFLCLGKQETIQFDGSTISEEFGVRTGSILKQILKA